MTDCVISKGANCVCNKGTSGCVIRHRLFKRGSYVQVVDGPHTGVHGTVEMIDGNRVLINVSGRTHGLTIVHYDHVNPDVYPKPQPNLFDEIEDEVNLSPEQLEELIQFFMTSEE